MTKLIPLLERNEEFARTYSPAALGLPAVPVVVVTCLDHRIDPALVLGLDSATRPSSATPVDASRRPSSTTSPTSRSSPSS